MKNVTIGCAVIGYGLMGQRHAQIIQACDGFVLRGVFDHEHGKLEQLSEGVERYASFEAALADPGVNLVILCTPSALHGQQALLAADRQKHVLIEKPIDPDPETAARVAETFASRGLMCSVVSQNRFSRGLMALRTAVEAGLLGKLVLGKASVKWYRHDPYYAESSWRGRQSGERGGVLMNQAVHSIDILHWLLGPPVEVASMQAHNRTTVMETEDTAIALLRFEKDVLVTLEASTFAYPGFLEYYELHGDGGTCIVENGEIRFWNSKVSETPPDDATPPTRLSGKLAPFERQYQNVYMHICNKRPLAVTSTEAAAVVATLSAMYTSSTTGLFMRPEAPR